MTYMYNDKSLEYMVSMLPDSWRDTFRDVWNLHPEAHFLDVIQTRSGITALALSRHEVDPENVADLRLSAAMVTMNSEEFHSTEHALACSRILTAAACDNPAERRRLLQEAHGYLVGWDSTRNQKG
ncbi:MAG: hypothetical protein HXO65_00125 [Rothia mucilaginosa]|uniref:Uncharacterized protein n=1 Tax=Rothia mucilaginosa TaxID=43675 RepID=A0A930LLY2_9MICC|nr:hypothetical protein [Rothia mucilaginosa]